MGVVLGFLRVCFLCCKCMFCECVFGLFYEHIFRIFVSVVTEFYEYIFRPSSMFFLSSCDCTFGLFLWAFVSVVLGGLSVRFHECCKCVFQAFCSCVLGLFYERILSSFAGVVTEVCEYIWAFVDTFVKLFVIVFLCFFFGCGFRFFARLFSGVVSVCFRLFVSVVLVFFLRAHV